jgi:hypothetical protein
MSSIDSNLSAVAGDQYKNLQAPLWTTIDDEIQLNDCDIYSYNPDLNSDPFSEPGCLWSFNYFFYNKKLKRIVFFTCRAIKYANTFNSFERKIKLSLSLCLSVAFFLLLYFGNNRSSKNNPC